MASLNWDLQFLKDQFSYESKSYGMHRQRRFDARENQNREDTK